MRVSDTNMTEKEHIYDMKPIGIIKICALSDRNDMK